MQNIHMKIGLGMEALKMGAVGEVRINLPDHVANDHRGHADHHIGIDPVIKMACPTHDEPLMRRAHLNAPFLDKKACSAKK